MPKKTKESKLLRGYADWSRSKTIKEAVNVSRWNPWLAHEWMNEASRGISINDYKVMDEHDEAADKINQGWNNRIKYRFHNQKDFWNGLPPKMIKKIIPDDEYDIISNEEE